MDQGPEARLASGRQLEAPALGQVAQAEEDEVSPGKLERGADDLDQAPPRVGLDTDLNGIADVLALNAVERPQHQFVVVGMDQAQARDPDAVRQRQAEEAQCSRVAPYDAALLVDDDDAVGQLQHGAGERGHVGGGRTGRPKGRERVGNGGRHVVWRTVLPARSHPQFPHPQVVPAHPCCFGQFDLNDGCDLVAQARSARRGGVERCRGLLGRARLRRRSPSP